MSEQGQQITVTPTGELEVPDHPIVLFIEGDGTGPDIWRAARPVLDAAVAKAYGGAKKIIWQEVLAGEKAFRETGHYLPEETLQALRQYRVALKGPLTTPVGGGFRSLNVTLRQVLDLYACIRPVRYYPGVPSPLKEPEKINMVVFRENTEDVYAGLEWPAGSPEARRLIDFLNRELGCGLKPGAAIGLKPMTEHGSKRLVRRAVKYALERGCASVTLMHKGNIMKYTEG
ncbi:MAG: NADP-dependent isocitrate dehydrogenase, partial [Deltaproteobacteria bacterium]|nr:NADP-dependent isocitrate dehydrogenase [Deltaproteobacteria bacterium]